MALRGRNRKENKKIKTNIVAIDGKPPPRF
jgi:hypothetical protein